MLQINSTLQRRAGWSLIESMVALTIVAILAALTLPSFHRHLVKTKRTQVQAVLLQLMQQEERYYSQNNRYLEFSSSSTDPDEQRFPWWLGASAAESAYEIRGMACTGESIAQCVQLTAMPGTERVDSSFADADCETLSLSSTGRRFASGAALHCWP